MIARNLKGGTIVRLLAILLSAASLCAILFGSREDKTVPPVPTEMLREGDLAFRRGIGYASDAVLLADSEGRYSHIGIVVCQGGVWSVVHAVPDERPPGETTDRVKIDRIEEFFAPDKAKIGEIIRVACPDSTARRAARIAVGKIGVPFDHDYNLADTASLYCTELVRLSFRAAGSELRQGSLTQVSFPFFSGDYLLPSDIYESNKDSVIFKY